MSSKVDIPRMIRIADLGEGVASITALSRSDFSSMSKSIVVPADGWPRFSQSAGTVCHVCLTRMSSHCAIEVAKAGRGTGVRKNSAGSQMSRMRVEGGLQMVGLDGYIRRGTRTLTSGNWDAELLWCILFLENGKTFHIPGHRPWIKTDLELH